MKVFTSLIFVLMLISFAESWQVMLGGRLDDQAHGIALSPNGGIVIVGSTEMKPDGNRDIIVAAINPNGKLLWQKRYSTPVDEIAESIAAIPTGGYIIAGNIYPERNSSVSAPLLIRIDNSGRIVWQKTLSATEYLLVRSVMASESGHILIGGEHGNMNAGAWAAKMNLNGEFIWQEKIGGTENVLTHFSAASATKDGGIVGVGQRVVISGVIDIWAAKLSASGKIEWQNSYRFQPTADGGLAVTEAVDGGYLIAGEVFNSLTVLKVNSKGEIQWQK